MSCIRRRAAMIACSLSMVLALAACGSEAAQQTQVVAATPTSIPTTAPLVVPTVTPEPTPAPTPTPLPQPTPTPLPTPAPAPTAPPAPTAEAAPSPTPSAGAEAAPTATTAPAPTATATAAQVDETPTPVETATVEVADPTPTPTTATETPTAVVASGEPPLECYDPVVQVYRGFVEGVDALGFETGKVTCTGAGTNAVSAARSYRHSSGLVVQRAANFILNSAGSGYIPYSGLMHFCLNGQPSSAPLQADTVPLLLIVIDNEAQRQVAQGAVGPATFTAGGSQC